MKKTKRIEIRIDLFEEKLIKVKAKEAGLKVSEYIRRAALDKNIKAAFDEEERAMYMKLLLFGSNFSRASNFFKEAKYQDAAELLKETALAIKQHLKKIRSNENES